MIKIIKLLINLVVILAFLTSSISYGKDDLNKEYKKFIKETKKIRKQFNSLPLGTSPESLIIDSAIKEIDIVISFASENFINNNINVAEMTLNYIDKSLSDIKKITPKEFTNDLSSIDTKKMQKGDIEQIMQTSQKIKNDKKGKLTSLVKDMTEIEKNGINLFKVSNNLNNLGVKTLNFEEIAKVASEDPSLKAEVLEAAKKGISQKDFNKQLEKIAEAERLGIAESTSMAAAALNSAGIDKDVMPTLETMKNLDFDAVAHIEAMEELAADIASGDISSNISKAEAAVNYSEADRASQKSKSDAECSPNCGTTESGD